MFDKPQVMIVMAIALVAGAFAGCGGSSPAAALKDPGVRGVDALRQAVRAALLNHDARSQCELFAPSLIEAHGGSTDTCAALQAQPEDVPRRRPHRNRRKPGELRAPSLLLPRGRSAILGPRNP